MPINQFTLALAGLGFLAAVTAEANAQEALKVVATIKPVHSIAAAVMEGAGSPSLLLKGASSPHSYSLRPSEAKSLSEADIVIRVSENLETFLEKPIKSLSKNAKLVTLSEIDGIKLLPVREGGAFESHDHDHGHDHGHSHKKNEKKESHAHDEHEHGHEDEGHDAHLWLSPANAAVIADHLAAVFGEARPDQADRFKTNAAAFKTRLSELDAELRGVLEPLKGKPFIVFHDAYHYLEDHYGLEAAGSITVSPERTPGAKRLRAIREKIGKTKSACVFSEPQFEPKLVETLTEGTDAKSGVLDPLGADLPENKDQYFTLMRNLAKNLSDCLGGAA